LLEFEAHINKAKEMPNAKFIDEVLTLSTLYDIYSSLEPATSNLSTEQSRALQSLPNPLWNLYDEWISRTMLFSEDIADFILDVADRRVAEDEEDRIEVDYDRFAIGDQECEDGQEP
jgi:hypothetical protein